MIGLSSHSCIAEVDAELRGGTLKEICFIVDSGSRQQASPHKTEKSAQLPPPERTWLALDRPAFFGYKSDDGVGVSSDRSYTNYIPHACGSAIAGMALEFRLEEKALRAHHILLSGGEEVPMMCRAGTHKIHFLTRFPSLARPTR